MGIFGILSLRESKAARRLAEEIELLRKSPLLDPVWYRRSYPDLRDTPVDVARHYLEHGAAEGRNPHPLFDTKFYLEQNPDVAASSMNPLVHFLQFGMQEFRNPHALFDTRWYLSNYQVPPGKNALEHFWEQGTQLSAQPHPLFDTKWYLASYPDVANGGLNPIIHYINYGATEGCDPNPFFSSRWYSQEYASARGSGINPLVHYVTVGWLQDCNPSSDFDVATYLALNADVSASGVEPLSHYLTHGRYEGRGFPHSPEWHNTRLREEISAKDRALAEQDHELAKLRHEAGTNHQLFVEAARALQFRNEEFNLLRGQLAALKGEFPKASEAEREAIRAAEIRDMELLAGSSFFDAAWYLHRYPDIAQTGIDPVIHYVNFGVSEGRNPGPKFSTQAYFAKRPNVAAAELNPLVHFLRFGIAEDPGPPPTYSIPLSPPEDIPQRRKNGRKALFVTHDANIGGAPAVLASVARWFQRHTDYDVRILSMVGGAWISALQEIAPTFVVGHIDVPADRVQAVQKEIRTFVGDEPAFIFLNSVASGGYCDVNPFHSPVVAYVHELKKVLNIYQRSFEKLIARADHVFCDGPMVQSMLRELTGAKDDMFSNRPAFIDVSPEASFLTSVEKARIRGELGWPQNAQVVMGCGLVHWRKQPEVFIRVAAKIISSSDRNVRFVWIGGGEQLDQMRALVQELELAQHVQFIGHRDDLRDLLRAADVFALTSVEDPFPLVCLEAAAKSVPSVVFREATGMTAFIEPEGEMPAGIAVLLQDEEGFAEAVQRLLVNEEFRESLARTAYDRVVARYTAGSACEEMLRKIREIGNLPPRVTVVVPNYNCAGFLRQRLDSIRDQSFRDVEILLLDDKSTDGSRAVLSEFGKMQPETRLFFAEKNSGSPFRAWERGIKEARGELIWIAEADDWCEPSFLEHAVAAFGTTGVRLVHGRSIPVNQHGEIAGDYNELYLGRIAPDRWRASFSQPGGKEINLSLGRANSIPNASAVVVLRDSALRAIKVARCFRLAGDWAFYVTAIAGGQISYVHEAVNYHRRHDRTVTRSIEGTQVYFQELADVGALIRRLYGKNESRDAAFQALLREEADRFGFMKPLPEGHLPPGLSEPLRPGILYGVGDLSGGGAQMFAIRFVNEWAKRGAPVVLFVTGHEPDHPALRARLSPEVPVVTSDQIQSIGLARFMEDWGLRILVSGHWWADRQIAAWLEQVQMKIPWTIIMHGCYENVLSHQESFPNLFADFARAERYCDTWIWTAPKNKAVFEKGQIVPRKIHHIVNGFRPVPPSGLRRTDIGLPEGALVFTLASRAIEEKGWRVAIDAIQQIRSGGANARDVRLQLIGDGPLADELQDGGPLEGVHLVRYTARLADYIDLSDVCLLPSWFAGESLPLTLIEFLAQGKPAIVSDIGMCAWAVDAGVPEGAAGFVIERSGEGGAVPSQFLAAAMKKFVDDPYLAQAMASAARRAFKKFDFDFMIASYDEVFEELLKKYGPSSEKPPTNPPNIRESSSAILMRT